MGMMNGKIPIVNYQRTSTRPLLQLTEKLNNGNFFESYLTSQQRIVLDTLLSIQDSDTKLKVWHELMHGNATLDAEKVEIADKPGNEKDINGGKQENQNGEGAVENVNRGNDANDESENNENGSTPETGNNEAEEEDFSQLDLENFKQQIIGSEFIGNLSLKIRYVLWQCAIDSMYVDEADEINDHGEGILDYVLLDDNTSQEHYSSNSQIEMRDAAADVHKEDENYDDDYDDYDSETREDQQPNTEVRDKVEVRIEENNRMVIVLKISKDVLTKLRTNNIEEIMKNCNKIYHNFEHDKETMLKRLKLEETDELLDPTKKRTHHEMNGMENEETTNISTNGTNESADSSTEENVQDGKRPRRDSMHLPVNLGAANLSLKHLLSSIQENKPKLKITDYELKHLIMDVRKNRSKWASDERIGQEELYEACEKVVLELRNYTEHSTPFLNKVSKREAPNYHLIIKKSMDLNTVLKKLKTFQYNSKQEFVDDIMLIWKNCLTYNSDPSHFLRGHAIAMQKKSMQLIPLIPNIVVRNRADVEKEFEEMERDKDYEEEEEEEVAGSGRKGLNMGAHKPAKAHKTQDGSVGDEHPSKHAVEGHKQVAQKGEVKQENEEEEEEEAPTDGGEPKLAVDSTDAEKGPSKKRSSETEKALVEQREHHDPGTDGIQENIEKPNEGNQMNLDNEDEDDEDDDEEIADSQAYLVEKDDDRDDVEISVWKSLTAKVRAEICMRRSKYFKEGKLNNESKAFLKDPQKMKSFEQLYSEYHEQKELELQRKQMEQESIMKNGFRTAVKQEEEDQLPLQENPLDGGDPIEKDSNELDLENGMFLQEYDSMNSLPALAYTGVDSTVLDKEEDAWTKRMLEDEEQTPSIFLANRDKGLAPKMNRNIELIQQIRHICHKISLIRLLQNPAYSQGSRANGNPNHFVNNHQYKYHFINDSIDLDPVSQLPTHDYRANKELMWKLMYKNVGKIAMSNGFETTQPSAISMLTEISGDYLSNLIKSIKVHHESNSLSHTNSREILHMSLLENGINKPDDLYSYVEAEFTKKTKKLVDVKGKLEIFLRDLLRPTLQELSERNFEDESQSFVTGDFASEITGEDFFGFRELGLEREFGVLSSAVPLHLLSFQFQATDSEDKVQVKKVQPEEFDSVIYKKLAKQDVDERASMRTLRPILTKSFERSKVYRTKNPKNVGNAEQPEEATIEPEENHDLLLEDEDMVLKVKAGSKPRVPPTGKITVSNKKKVVGDMFLLPESDDNKEIQPQSTDMNSSFNTPQKVSTSEMETPGGSSFNLSLPKLNQDTQ